MTRKDDRRESFECVSGEAANGPDERSEADESESGEAASRKDDRRESFDVPDHGWTVREAIPADGVPLRCIQETALDEPWPDLLELGVDGPPLVLVAETDRPVGYALVVPDDAVGYVAEFAVAPDEQGQGYGSRLMRALLDRLRSDGVERVRLTARADDERVRSFYARFGFTAVESVPDHYEDGDAVVLARDLSRSD